MNTTVYVPSTRRERQEVFWSWTDRMVKRLVTSLAEQVLEFWQRDPNDYFPSIASDCVLTTGSSIPSPSVSATCTPTSGVSIAYAIVASNTQASGPLPSDLNTFQSFITPAGLTVTPMTKVVTVSWSHKGGTTHSVYLTHLTVVQ